MPLAGTAWQRTAAYFSGDFSLFVRKTVCIVIWSHPPLSDDNLRTLFFASQGGV